jgi:hypothetical protein
MEKCVKIQQEVGYGEVCKDTAGTRLSATSKMDCNEESASRRRHLT